MKEKSAAILTLHRPAEYSAKGRADIIRWLRRQIKFLAEHSEQMDTRFRARYIYTVTVKVRRKAGKGRVQ